MNFNLDYKNGIFEIKTFGTGDIKGIQSFIISLLEHDKWSPGSKIIVDYTECNLGNLTVDNIYQITQINHEVSTLLGDSKCAHIVSRDIEYGMVRMWEALVEDKWSVTEHVFRTREEALSWITQE